MPETKKNKYYFFISTNGHSASKWLAKTLNCHNEIICSHSPAKPSIAMMHDKEYSDADFKEIMSDEKRKKIPIDKLLDEIENFGDVTCYGNVHMFNLRQLIENKTVTKPAKRFVVVDLVRHPVSFVHSGTFNMIKQARYNPHRFNYLKEVYYRNKKLYDDFSKVYKLDLEDINTLSFMANVMTLKSLLINIKIKDVNRRLKMEEITSSRVKFIELVELLSGGSIVANEDYLDKVFGTVAVNKHLPSKLYKKLEDIFESWEIWQREFFRLLVNLTKIDKHYSKINYDLTFIK